MKNWDQSFFGLFDWLCVSITGGKNMANLKAHYYRFQHMIWFATGLIGIGVGLVVWWQCSQTAPVLPRDISPSVAADQSTQKAVSVTRTVQPAVQSATVVVDVKGAVHRPGVYKFTVPPIMADALEKAGGTLATVDRTRLNLAASLTNGQVLYIPNGSEIVPDAYPLPGQPNATAPSTTSATTATETSLVNLNTATVVELQTLPGVGEKRAQDIVTQRETMGGFKTVNDLQEVAGIGEKTYARLAPLVTV